MTVEAIAELPVARLAARILICFAHSFSLLFILRFSLARFPRNYLTSSATNCATTCRRFMRAIHRAMTS